MVENGEIIITAGSDQATEAAVEINEAAIIAKNVEIKAESNFSEKISSGIVTEDINSEIVINSSRIDAADSIKIKSNSNTDLEFGTSFLDSVDSADAALAISNIKSTSLVTVGGSDNEDTVLTAAGEINISADNKVNLKAKADAAGNDKLGGAVAVNKLETETRAVLENNVQINGDPTAVNIEANSKNMVESTALASTEGMIKDENSEQSNTEEQLQTYSSESSVSNSEGGSSGLDAAAAFAVNDVKSNTEAVIGGDDELKSNSDFKIESNSINDISGVADSSSTTGEGNSIGAAAALNLVKSRNKALVERELSINSLEIKTGTADYFDNNGADSSNKYKSHTVIGSSGDNISGAGGLSLNIIDQQNSSLLDSSLNLDGNLNLTANNNTKQKAETIPKENSDGSSKVGVGAAAAINISKNNLTEARITENAIINSAEKVNVEAVGINHTYTYAEAGVYGDLGVTPVSSISLIKNQVEAGISESVLETGNLNTESDLTIKSENSNKVNTFAIGSTASSGIGLGASMALNLIEDSSKAYLNRDVDKAGNITVESQNYSQALADSSAGVSGEKEKNDSEDESENLDNKIKSQLNFYQQKQGKNVSENKSAASASTKEGKLQAAAAVSVNIVEGSSEAEIAKPVDSEEEMQINAAHLEINSAGQTDSFLKADGSTDNNQIKAGMAAAAAVNKVNSTKNSLLGVGNYNIDSLTLNSRDTYNPFTEEVDLYSEFTAEAVSGAGAQKVGLSGALALNIIEENYSLIKIEADANIYLNEDSNSADLIVNAENRSNTRAAALPAGNGGSGDVGVGGSVAINDLNEGVEINISDNTDFKTEKRQLDKIELRAYSDFNTQTEAEAGAAGGVAVDTSLAFADLNHENNIYFGSGNTLNSNLDFRVVNISIGENFAEARGNTRADKVGIGASGSVILSNSKSSNGRMLEDSIYLNSIVVDRDLNIGGEIDLRAESNRSYQALSLASSMGADSSVSDSGEKSLSSKVMSENKDNQQVEESEAMKNSNEENDEKSSQLPSGGANVEVSASLGLLYLNDDIRAVIKGGSSQNDKRQLQAGDDINVEAINYSNYRTKADSFSVGQGITSVPENSIGAAAALNITRSNTSSYLGEYTQIIKADNINIGAKYFQNTAKDFADEISAESISGTASKKISGSASMALVNSQNSTTAYLGSSEFNDTGVSDLNINTYEISNISAAALSGAAGGKVGVGGSTAILYTDNENYAYLGSDSNIYVDNLNISAVSKEIDSNITEMDNFNSLDFRSLIGTKNYYTQAVAGSAGGNAAVSGSLVYNRISDSTKAYTGENTEITALKNINLSAENNKSAAASTGSVGLSKSIGAGLAGSNIIYDNETKSYIGKNNKIISYNNIQIMAANKQDLDLYGISTAAGGTFGLSGVFNYVNSKNTVEAFVDKSSSLMADKNIDLDVESEFSLLNLNGGAAAGGTVGIGVSAVVNKINNKSRAFIAEGAVIKEDFLKNILIVNPSVLSDSEIYLLAAAEEVEIAEDNYSWERYQLLSKADIEKLKQSGLDEVKVYRLIDNYSEEYTLAEDLKKIETKDIDHLKNYEFLTNDIIDKENNIELFAGDILSNEDKENLLDAGYESVEISAVLYQKGDRLSLGDLSTLKNNLGTNLRLTALNIEEDELQNEHKTDSLNINAQSSSMVKSLSAGIGAAGTFSLAGSSVITDLNGETSAYIESANGTKSDIVLTQILNIESREINTINTKAGALSFSGTAAVGGSYNQLDLNSNVNSYIGEDAEVEINRSRNNLSELNLSSELINRVDAETLGGAAAVSGGALGATYLNIRDQSSVKTYLADNGHYINIHLLTLDSDYKLKSEDTDQLRASALGAAAGLYLGAGAAKSDVIIDSTTSSYFGDNLIIEQEENYYLTGSQVKANAFSNYGVDNYAFAGSMGAGALNGSHTLTELNAETKAYTGNNFYLDLGKYYNRYNKFEILSQNRNNIKSRADGLNIGGISVGVSSSQSKLNNTVKSYLAENNQIKIAGDITIKAENLMPQNSGDYSASAESNSAVGTLFGGNGSIAKVRNYSEIYSGVGENGSIELRGDFSVNSFNRSSLNVEASGITAGLAAAGFTKAEINSAVKTRSEIAAGTNLKSAHKLYLKADSDDVFNTEVTSGSGGGITGNAAESEIYNNALTEVVYAGRTVKGLTAYDAYIYSDYNLRFNSVVDSLNASVVGGSGAGIDNDINSVVKIEIGSPTSPAVLNLNNLYLNASNNIIKLRPAAGKYNTEASSGGVLTGAASNSESRFNIRTNVKLHDSAKLRSRGDILIDAENLFNLYDRSKLDAAGVISTARSKSLLDVENSESIIKIENAELVSGRRMDIGASTQAYLSSSANTKTYGLASSAEGESYTMFNNENKVLINSGALLHSGRDLNIAAGTNSSGVINVLDLYASTDVYNKTINPVKEDNVKAYSSINENNTIEIKSGSTLTAVNDINLKSANSKRKISALGRGKDLYKKIKEDVANAFRKIVGEDEISIEIKTGSKNTTINRSVEVDGSLTAGIHNKINLEIDANGDVKEKSSGISYSQRSENIVSNLIDRISELRELQAVYSNDIDAYSAYEAEINFLLHSLKRRGLVDIDENGKIYPLRSIEVEKLAMNELYASGGDINIESIILKGGASLTANSNPEINILNQSDKFLELNKVVIGEIGGRVKFNQKQIDQHSNLNIKNNYDPDNYYPQIIVHNTFKPLKENEVGTDINIQNTIFNELGEIKITSDEGNIYIQGEDSEDSNNAPDLTAETVNLKAGQDIVQSYKEGFEHVGGDPKQLWKDVQIDMETSPESEGSNNELRSAVGSRIVGNNIFLSATHLNLNGFIQSGLPYWNLVLSNLETQIKGYVKDWNDAGKPDLKNFNDLQKYQLSAFDNENRRDDQQIAAYFNPQKEQIELNNAVVKGGYIEIFGEISNTGGGEIKAVDGYGRININNNTPYDMVINRLDTGNDIESLIRITDTANKIVLERNGKSKVVPITTEYRRYGNKISINESVSFNDNGQQINQNLETNYSYGRNTSYTPIEGLRYNWTLGEDFTERFVGVGKSEKFLGFIDFGNDDYNVSWDKISDGDLEPLKDGIYTGVVRDIDGDGSSQNYEYKLRDYVTESMKRVSRERWKEWVWKKLSNEYYVRDTWEKGSQDVHTHSLKADHKIPIEFIGEDSGELSIVSSGGGDIILNGSLNNGKGSIDISADAAVNQYNDNARLIADSFNFIANRGIGENQSSLKLDARNDGFIKAHSANGDIFLEDTVSNMNIFNIDAAGKISLQAAGDIYSRINTDTAKVRGAEIELSSKNGSIGSSSKPLLINSTADKGLSVLALNDINIREVEGDLPLNSVKSIAGSINLEVASGNLTDANKNEIRDQRTIDELNRQWDEMLLSGEAAEESKKNALREYSRIKEAEYYEYWRLRGLEAKKYDKNGDIIYTVKQYAEEDADSRLKKLHKIYGMNEYKNNWSFIDDFSEDEKDRAVADMTWTEKRSQLLDGYKWTEDELQNSLSRAILMKETTDTVTVIEEANLEAQNIYLNAKNGSIGVNKGEIIIDVNNMTNYERAKLLAAEEKDIIINNENEKITIIDRESIDIKLSEDGSITAEALDHIYLGSEKSIYIDSIVGGKQIRVKGKNGLYSTGTEAEVNIEGSSTILEGGDGALGTTDKELILKLKQGADFTARSAKDINVYQKDGGLNLAFIYSKEGDVNLTADGYINDRRGEIRDYSISANNLNLESKNHSIGSKDLSLYINLNQGSVSNLKAAESIFIKEFDGDLNLDTAKAAEKVVIVADNSINFVEDSGEIRADIIELKAENGDIGSQNGRIKTYSGSELNVRAENNVFLSEFNGHLNSKYLLSNNIIDILIPDGNLKAENIKASKFKAELLKTGSSIMIGELNIEEELQFWADNVDIKKLIHKSDLPLNMLIKGSSGKMLNDLKFRAQSESGLIFTDLSADYAEIEAAADWVQFYDLQVGSRADITNNNYRVIADNVNEILHDSHLQLYPEKQPFNLFLNSEQKMITDAYAVNYDDDFIINEFSSENSFIRKSSRLNSILQDNSGGSDFYKAGKGSILSLNNLIEIDSLLEYSEEKEDYRPDSSGVYPAGEVEDDKENNLVVSDGDLNEL